MMNQKLLHLVGYASSLGGPEPTSGTGPLVLKESSCLNALSTVGVQLEWDGLITDQDSHPSKLDIIAHQCHALGQMVFKIAKKKEFFLVLGGDHSSAIGTWSGAKQALQEGEKLGLIWIDAHMDSHTPQTTLTGNIHGMPLACLLGVGDAVLTNILVPSPVVYPENICLIGIRSFEEAEAALLTRLKVRIFYMDEVNQRGIDAVMQDALSIVTRGTAAFGVSLDIDSIDPMDAPATDVSEPGGIRAIPLCAALSRLANHPNCMGAEIAEFNPHRDIDQKTEKLIPELIKSIVLGSAT